MQETPLTLAELLDQAAAASSLGDREEAERLFRRATERSPANTRAWLGLAAAVESLEEKRACFERVLTIDPDNSEARAALQRLTQLLADSQAGQPAGTATSRPGSSPSTRQRSPAATRPTAHVHEPTSDGQVLYCVNHPDTETTLRCNRCGKPVCVKCVELTEVGYRCKECIRQQQGIFYTAQPLDYLIAALVAFVLAAVAAPLISTLLGMFGFFSWLIAFMAGPAVGGMAAGIIRSAISRRRGRYLGIVAVAAIIVGTLVGLLAGALFGLPINLLIVGLFVALALSTIYATLR